MTQTPKLSTNSDQPKAPAIVNHPSPYDANPLQAWGLDSSFPPYTPEALEPRSEIKPLGVVCEPVN